MSNLDRIKRITTARKATIAEADAAGRNAALHGSDESNAHFRFFGSPELTASWQYGYDEAKAEGERSEGK